MQDSKELQEILKKYEEQTKSGNTLTPEEACAANPSLLEAFNRHIAELEQWLGSKSDSDPQVHLLMTQKGVGYLTALALVNTLGDVSRFERVPKQVTNFIGYDSMDQSSAGKRRFGGISKAGSPLVRFMIGQAAQTAIR